MSGFATNVVTHVSSKTLGVLFMNTNLEDPNIYVLYSGHVRDNTSNTSKSVDGTNVTFLTYHDLTLYAKCINYNIWIDVSVAVIENPSYVDFPVTTQLVFEYKYGENEAVTFFSGYELNNALARPVTSQVRDPNFRYPQKLNHFFYPESILLQEAQGTKGASGTPVINSSNQVIALGSKIIGDGIDSPKNLVCTKMSMVYLYLFDANYGLITKYFQAYTKTPTINTSFNLLNAFKNSFNIVMCHPGFKFRTSRDVVSNTGLNLNKNVNGIFLSKRITGINLNTYEIVSYSIKGDPDIVYFQTLFDFTDINNDFYMTKNRVVFKTFTYTDRAGSTKTLDLGLDSMAPYIVNGDPSQPITVGYYNYGPAGPDGLSLVYSPLKTVTVQPVLIPDTTPGTTRWSSQLPLVFTRTSIRANRIMHMNLYNTLVGGGGYNINYANYSTQIQNLLQKYSYSPYSQYKIKQGASNNTPISQIQNQLNAITDELAHAFSNWQPNIQQPMPIL